MERNTWAASDSISYYNTKYGKSDSSTKDLSIKGSFHKVKIQGGAAPKDIDEISGLYKKSFLTMILIGVHTYLV